MVRLRAEDKQELEEEHVLELGCDSLAPDLRLLTPEVAVRRHPGSGAPFAGEQLSDATVGIPRTDGLQAGRACQAWGVCKSPGAQQKGSHPSTAVAKAECCVTGLGLSWAQDCSNSCLQATLLRAGLGLESYLQGRAARETNAQNSQDSLVPSNTYGGIQLLIHTCPHRQSEGPHPPTLQQSHSKFKSVQTRNRAYFAFCQGGGVSADTLGGEGWGIPATSLPWQEALVQGLPCGDVVSGEVRSKRDFKTNAHVFSSGKAETALCALFLNLQGRERRIPGQRVGVTPGQRDGLPKDRLCPGQGGAQKAGWRGGGDCPTEARRAPEEQQD
ncbi:uncharacterized protein LOC141582496 [Saimiri boliviensis]|uniref:uncharacterized protein LOC141582496 n=1 Tax=Saimiri boliviensis TaxID=27679 RepID=UPI003D77DB91